MTTKEETDGNVQEMLQADKPHPSRAATWESQDADSQPPQVVGVPAFTDPNNPTAAMGSINLSLDQHPFNHSPDYGQDYEPQDSVETTQDIHAADLSEMAPDDTAGDVSEWRATDWREAIAAADDADALAELREQYDSSGADFATVEAAFEQAGNRLSTETS